MKQRKTCAHCGTTGDDELFAARTVTGLWRQSVYCADCRAPTMVPIEGWRGYVPAGPFVAWVLRHIEDFDTVQEMAWTIGCSDRRIRSLLHGQQPKVSINVVDRALIEWGDERLDSLFPVADEQLELAA